MCNDAVVYHNRAQTIFVLSLCSGQSQAFLVPLNLIHSLYFLFCISSSFLAVKSYSEHICIDYLPNYILPPYFSYYYNKSLYPCAINKPTCNAWGWDPGDSAVCDLQPKWSCDLQHSTSALTGLDEQFERPDLISRLYNCLDCILQIYCSSGKYPPNLILSLRS